MRALGTRSLPARLRVNGARMMRFGKVKSPTVMGSYKCVTRFSSGLRSINLGSRVPLGVRHGLAGALAARTVTVVLEHAVQQAGESLFDLRPARDVDHLDALLLGADQACFTQHAVVK